MDTNSDKIPMPSLQQILLSDYIRENQVLNLLPVAVFVCNMEGAIQKYNEEAVRLWGRRPEAGNKSERFGGACKLYHLDGSFLPLDQGAVAACLRDGKPRENVEVILERPDQTHIIVRANIVPLVDEEGKQVGVINCFYDISDQKTTEKELKKRTQELQDYVDNAPLGLHWVDAQGIIIWANKAELDMLGYSKEEYIGHHISEFHVQEEKISDILRRLNCNETLSHYESELRCKDGTIKVVQINSNVFWEDGKFIHTRCFTVDVTAQKKLFTALRDSEERQRQVLEGLPIAIYTCDADGYITFYNQAATQLWGREPRLEKDRWCGSWVIKSPNGRPLSFDECPMARCLKEGRAVRGEIILVEKPNGETRHVLPHPQPLFDGAGKMTGAVNMLLDITEARKTERALRENEKKYRELAASLEKTVEEKTQDLKSKNEELKRSEERYHKMVEEVEDYAIILLDENGIIQNWNKGAEKIKGYKEREIVGKSFKVFYLPQDREAGLPDQLINRARYQGKAVHEGWRMRKDGTRFWGSIVLTALHNDRQEVIGFSKVTRDLTERKLTEDKMKAYTDQLEFQNEQLEQFAYAASHDMKEPLRKILFYGNHLWETISGGLGEKEKEYLLRSLNAANRMKVLIDDLLEYSRTSSYTQEFEEVDLIEIAGEVLFSHKEGIEEKGARVRVAALPVIKGIPFQLRQLFDNLLSNALKYHHPRRQLEIVIAADKVMGNDETGELISDREYHKISICDNGSGFDPRFSEKIFELFQRLPGVPKSSGTGVGLALCKKIVQNHYGVIKAVGTLEEGSCFVMYFPA